MTESRSRARAHALQAIYQWQVGGQDIGEILSQFLEDDGRRDFDRRYFEDLVRGVPLRIDELDDALAPLLDRAIDSVDPVERAILRLGAYEFSHHLEVPYRVVIDEAVELAKTYGAEQGHRYVNGVLDRLARVTRQTETARPAG